MKQIQIRNSGVNPFLVNPVKAVFNSEDVGISHCVGHADGILCIIELKDGKSSQANLEDVQFLNKHEFERFEKLAKMLIKMRYLKNSDCIKYGFSVE